MRSDRKQCAYKGAWSGQQGRSNVHQKGHMLWDSRVRSQVPPGEHHTGKGTTE